MSTLRHHPDPDVAGVAALIGDPGRATMLHALLGGGELPASELAARAGITPQAATAHLKKLVAAGLLATHPSGRQRIFRLNSPEVGHALEALALIARPTRVVALEQSSALARLRAARSCYDHLAGRLGVAVTDALLERRILRPEGEHFGLTPAGARTLHGMGVDVEGARASR
ncbi:MAG: winged helix-turn-helix transcriptional regulator, partial [bacterium]|nr:winged helix-turn-helix transcriptional regulator [bacterium]